MTSKILFGFLSALAFISPASAADLSEAGYKDDSVSRPPQWAGFYVGVAGGYGWSAADSMASAAAVYATGATPPLVYKLSPTERFERSGGFGGLEAGYNLQRGALVFGLETDLQGSNIKGIGSAFASLPVGPALTVSSSAYAQGGLEWFGSLRGRVGYALDRTLLYATGGLAYGGTRAVVSTTLDERYSRVLTASATRIGYAVGGGVEYALSPKCSVKGEYEYLDFGNSVRGAAGFAINREGTMGVFTTQPAFNTVRIGVNYKLQEIPDPLN